MEFLRGIFQNNEVLGIKQDEKVYLTKDIKQIKDITTMIELIETLDDMTLSQIKADICENKLQGINLNDIKLLSPIKRPIHDIICVGINYKDHATEVRGKVDIQETPSAVYFSKRACEIAGPDEPIKGHLDLDHRLDYEVELAVIIGKKGCNIPAQKADEYIFGYSIANDITARGLQKNHGQWFKGKSLDSFSVLGPWIVEKSDFSLPLSLDIKCSVNGELRQNSNTASFIRDIPSLIEELSKGCTLEAGDIILTGTPAGVGMGFNPSKFLKSGDIVECAIQGIGILKNQII